MAYENFNAETMNKIATTAIEEIEQQKYKGYINKIQEAAKSGKFHIIIKGDE